MMNDYGYVNPYQESQKFPGVPQQPVEGGPLAGLQGQIAGVLNTADRTDSTCLGRRAP
jgi:hypothetical protein